MFDLSIDGVLGDYKETNLSVRLVGTILKVIPGAPVYVHYHTVEDAVRAINPDATAAQFAKARALSNDPKIKKILWMGRLIDGADSAFVVATGIRSGWNFFFGDKSKGLENDKEQAWDATVKMLGISYMLWHAYPGTVVEKAVAFKSSPAGQTIATYYGVADIALPFSDNALSSGGNFIGSLWSKYGDGQSERLAGMLGGGESLTGPMKMLQMIIKPVEAITASVGPHVANIAATVKQYIPGIMATTDKVAGVVASGVDMLDVYRLLSARLAAESAARGALGKFDPISPITIADDGEAVGAEASHQARQFFILGCALIGAADVQLSSREQVWLDANSGAGTSEKVLSLIESHGLDGLQGELQKVALLLSPDDKHWLHRHAWQLGDLAGSDGTDAEEDKEMANVLMLCGFYDLNEPVRNALWENRSAGAA